MRVWWAIGPLIRARGAVLQDQSGQGNDGQIHGAKWVKSGQGYALLFDGKTDYVDCGNGATLDITGPITIQAWIHPKLGNKPDAGILGKSYDSYILTYHKYNPHFYLCNTGNNVACPAGMDYWSHIAATFDGTTMRIYRNGQEIEFQESAYKQITHGKNFMIGCHASHTNFFSGIIDTMRVHNRALS